MSSTFDIDEHIRDVLRIQRPTGPSVALASAFIKRWFKPTVVGAERLPKGPLLFIGNHALLALDGMIFHLLMHYDHGRFLRALGDRSLFENPQYRDMVVSMGAAVGQPEVCDALMSEGHDMLIFPGGTYEAVKPPEKRYELMWRQRYGFIRLAAAAGYTIMPFACVGPEEYFDQYLTGEEVYHSPVFKKLQQLGVIPQEIRSDIIPPLPAGVFGSAFPKPKPTFFGFGRPVDLSTYKGKTLTQKQQEKLRDQVGSEIDREIKNLLLLREQRRHKDGLLRRILSL